MTAVIHQVNAKLAALERREAYLERQLNGEGKEMSAGGRDFAAAELAAIKAGALALRMHRNEVEGLPTLLELVRAFADQLRNRPDLGDDLTRLVKRATDTIRELDAPP